jgi:predicted metal-dependent peptidase
MNTNLQDVSVEDRIALARDYVRKRAPYFARVLYGLQFIAVPGLGTMATTKALVCGYDPAYVAATPPDVLAADIAHEIMHVLERHFDRLAHCTDRKRANIAADFPINTALRNALHNGKPIWPLHPTAVMPAQFGLPDGKTAEQYYDLLKKHEAAKKKAGGGQGQNTAPGDPNPGQGQGSSPQGQAPSQEQGPNQAQPGQGVGQGNCGSVAGGVDHPALAGVEGRSEIEKKAMVMQVAKAVKDHVEQHGRGSVPESLVDWLDIQNRPKKRDWRRHLGQIVRECTGRIQAGGADFSMRRPSKRSYVRGMLRPGLIENLPTVGFVLDTSGSMGQKQLAAAVGEAVAILEALGIDEVWFAEADAAVAMKFRLVAANFFRKLQILGRGGTDFRPAFTAATKLDPPLDLLVYFTDGDGYAPLHPPRNIETVWCIVPSSYNRRPAPWGHAVLVTEDPNVKLEDPLVDVA